ncbi:hypothetical protein JCM8097_007405 [Rhodosporidiobolus ruineniae]
MMGHGSDSPQGSVDGTDSKDTTPKSTLSRPSSRRTLRSFPSSDGSTSHPLFAGPASSPSAEPAGRYAVYNPGKKRASLAGSGLLSPNSASSPTASPLSPSDQPLSPLHSSSSTPPFTPATLTPTLPPLVSRPSNSTLPTTSGRPYARSVSEAQETLKKQALKAELQGLGLAPESIGAALVARLGAAGGEAELKGVQAAIGSGKVTLLLPAEKADPSSPISTAFLLDHLILLDRERSSRNGSPGPQGFATLTGLRGYLSTDELVFTSCGSALVESEGALAAGTVDYADETVQRSLRGSAAPPSPPQSPHYPSTMLVSSLSSLSIPTSTSASSSAPASSSARSTATSRLAALFAKPTPAAVSENTADLPPVVPAPAGLFGSDTSSSEGSSGRRGSTATLDVPVLAVGKAIRHAEVVAAIGAGVEAQLREASRTVPGTDGEAAPVEHLVSFAARFQPPPSFSSSTATPTEAASSPSSPLYSASVDTASDAFQDTLHSVRLDLTRNLGSAPPAPSASSSSSSSATPAPTPSLEDFAALEDRVDASLEELESALTSTLHDRLYAPTTARDLSDDEQLCSRVAALNVLELDLDHLGLELGDEEGLEGWKGERRLAREALEELADRVGKELNRLEDADQRTPAAKLAILVECHTLLVDGLSKLPPVPLKKELGDGLGGSPSTSSSAPHEVEMDDASSRASSAPPSRPLSPPAPANAEEDLQKTPKPHQAMLEQDVPEIRLPGSSAPSADGELSSSMLEAASSSLYDPTSTASPPVSVFESSRPASSKSTTSSADLILPLLIFSVVRANPPHIVSHLSFIQRFRSDSLLRGQSSYCLTNFSAVVEFLTHLDVSALGITSQRLLGLSSPAASPALSTASSSSSSSLFPAAFGGGRPRAHTTGRLRDRLPQDAAALVGAAGTNLFGVVDSSYRLIFSGARGAAGVVGGAAPRSLEEVKSVLEGARGRARVSLPFRRAGSSRTFGSAATSGEDAGAEAPAGAGAGAATAQREMVDITPSMPDTAPADAYAALPSSTTAPPPPPPRHPDTASLSSSPTKPPLPKRDDSDARSIRSISSLIKESTLGRALGEVRDGVVAGATSPGLVTSGGGGGGGEDRPQSLGERLAGLPLAGLARFGGGGGAAATSSSPAGSRRSTILNPVVEASEPASEEQRRRFMEVGSAAELRLGEVQVLLEEWRRAVRRVEELEAVAKAGDGGEKKEGEAAAGQ